MLKSMGFPSGKNSYVKIREVLKYKQTYDIIKKILRGENAWKKVMKALGLYIYIYIS